MGVYNWLDNKLGGVLPGGVPRGGSKQKGSDPENTEDQVAKAAGVTQEAKNSKKPTPTKKKITFQSLSYPSGLDNTDEFPHQIMFNVLIRQTDAEAAANSHLGDAGRGEDLMSNLSNDQAAGIVKEVTGGVTAGIGTTAVVSGGVGTKLAGAALVAASGKIGDLAKGLVETKTTRKCVARIRMAMPMSPKNEMQAQWDVTDFGSIMGALVENGGSQGVIDMLKSADGSSEAGQALLRTAAGTLNITKQLGVNLPLQSSIELMSRKVQNPFTETLFKTMNFRNFPFTFKFAPKNSQELLQALKIVNVFERYMTPEKSGTGLFLEYPAEFEIIYQYKNKENAYFTNFFNDTALVNFIVDYGNGGHYTAFQGTEGAPSEITMSVNFKELTLLHRDSIVDITGQEDVMGGFQGLGPSVSGEVPAEEPPAEETITETSSAEPAGESG